MKKELWDKEGHLTDAGNALSKKAFKAIWPLFRRLTPRQCIEAEVILERQVGWASTQRRMRQQKPLEEKPKKRVRL